jgi:hypothetical protein
VSNRGKWPGGGWRSLVVKLVMCLGALYLAAVPVDPPGRQNAARDLAGEIDELHRNPDRTPEELRELVKQRLERIRNSMKVVSHSPPDRRPALDDAAQTAVDASDPPAAPATAPAPHPHDE